MNKQQFDKLKSELKKLGYRECDTTFNHSDYYLYKSFHKDDNKWDEERAGIQIMLYVYDYTLHKEYRDRLPDNMRNHVGIEIHYDVSRIIDERIEMVQSWHDDTKIEDVEYIAEKFYKWICEIIPEPKTTE